MYNFKEKVVLITGAGRGSGEQMARDFLVRGATVVATDLRAPDWDAGENEDKIIRLPMNVCNESEIVAAIKEANQKTSGITILVNNAGLCIEDDTHELSVESFNHSLNLNLTGAFVATREVVASMLRKKQSGSIINISSVAGRNAFGRCAAYAAAKAGMIGFTRSLAVEYGPADITVNAVCPGTVDTPMIVGVIDNISKATGMTEAEVREMMCKGIPMQRMQTPQDISNMVMFLASNLARNITGEAINVDGGSVRC